MIIFFCFCIVCILFKIPYQVWDKYLIYSMVVFTVCHLKAANLVTKNGTFNLAAVS